MNGVPELGAFSFSGSAAIVEALATTDLAWFCLDAQHGRWDDASILAGLDALGGGVRNDGVRIYVRPRSSAFDAIGRALDCGAAGIIVPMIETPDEARAVVQAARFPPRGRRSFGPIVAPFGAEDDLAAADEGVLVAVMIETASALRDVDAIAEVEGVDMLFVGPFDLALSLGTTVEELVADTSAGAPLVSIAAAARRHGVRLGAFAGDPGRVAAFQALGADFISVTDDLSAAVSGAHAALSRIG